MTVVLSIQPQINAKIQKNELQGSDKKALSDSIMKKAMNLEKFDGKIAKIKEHGEAEDKKENKGKGKLQQQETRASSSKKTTSNPSSKENRKNQEALTLNSNKAMNSSTAISTTTLMKTSSPEVHSTTKSQLGSPQSITGTVLSMKNPSIEATNALSTTSVLPLITSSSSNNTSVLGRETADFEMVDDILKGKKRRMKHHDNLETLRRQLFEKIKRQQEKKLKKAGATKNGTSKGVEIETAEMPIIKDLVPPLLPENAVPRKRLPSEIPPDNVFQLSAGASGGGAVQGQVDSPNGTIPIKDLIQPTDKQLVIDLNNEGYMTASTLCQNEVCVNLSDSISIYSLNLLSKIYFRCVPVS
jgi:hypothetical protein